MSLPKRDKKLQKIKVTKLPTCAHCGAVGRHYSYMCPDNPKTKCSNCGSRNHTSIMCFDKPRKAIKQESDSARSKRIATSREWFRLNPPNEKGVWFCYLRISPDCPIKLTRSTITLEHVKSKVRYPQLKYDVNNLKPACAPCNRLKGSLDVDELPGLGSIRVIKDTE